MRSFTRIPLAWLQLTRNKVRLLVALFGIAFASILIFMQLGFLGSLFESQTALHYRLKADLVLINAKVKTLSQTPATFPRQQLYRTLNFDEVESVNSLYLGRRPLTYNGVRASSLIVVLGINPNDPPLEIPNLDQSVSLLKTPGFVLFDANSDLKEYDTLLEDLEQEQPLEAEITDKRIWIGAPVDFAGASFSDNGNLITSTATYSQLMGLKSKDDLEIGLVNLKPGVDPQVALAKIRRQLPDDIKVMTLDDLIAMEEHFWSSVAPFGFVFTTGVFVSFLVGVIIVYQILYSDVSEHLSDYAVLKARGYKNRYFLKILFQESFLLAVMGYIPGLAVSLGLYGFTEAVTALPMTMSFSRATFVLVLAVLMCFVSGVISMRKLREADPAELFS